MALFKNILAIILLGLSSLSGSSRATIIQLETNFGNIEVNLYDNGTPNTVANFLAYVNSGAYAQSIVHRAEPNFVIQAGGFAYSGSWPASAIAANAAVVNEPVYSNVRGTIAMAKLSGQPNSATNQWFINLANNSANLDGQNGGFTVFGQVTGSGMAIVDQIGNLNRYNKGGAFGSLPLQNYDGTSDPDATNLVTINSVLIIDATVDSAAALTRPINRSGESNSSSSGGGSMGWLLLPLFLLAGFGRRKEVAGTSHSLLG